MSSEFPGPRPNTEAAGVRPADRSCTPSERALRDAFRDLLHERSFDGITVREVVRRARVGRTTFYEHFGDKGDLLLASFGDMLESMTARLRHDPPRARRLLPVREFFEHVASAETVLRNFAGTREGDMLWELARLHFARAVEPAAGSALRGHFVAGAMIGALHRWLRAEPRPSAAAVDAEFHSMARAALRAPPPWPPS